MTTGLAQARKAFAGGDYIAALTHLSGMLDAGKDAEVLTLLGETFEKLGLGDDALDIFSQAADLEPTPSTLKRATRAAFAANDDARIQLYGMKSHALAPGDAEVAFALATSLLRNGEAEIARLVRAALVDSDDPDHIRMAAELHADEDRDPVVLTVFRKFAALFPDDPFAQFKYRSVARDFCDYEALEALDRRWGAAVRDSVTSVIEGETPYSNILYCADERLNRLATNGAPKTMPSRSAIEARRKGFGHIWGERLRIGYLSNDFWGDHATMRLLRSVLAAHDRQRFEITLYCHTAERFTVTDDADRSDWGRIVPIHAMTDAEAAAAIRADGIDILVDLKGHTAGARCGILNLGAAPVQVAWLGFPGSTVGVDCDYVIGDAIVLPDSSAPFYHEHICRMPDTYQPNDPVHRQRPPAASRAELGLPEDRFVFAAFNSARKMSAETIDAWSQILCRAPDALLWVMIDSEVARANFTRAMAKRGVGADQLHFAAKTRYDTHVARLQAADLGLDSFPYNGHTTTSDQLWAGLPVITRRGTNFASRVTESLLSAAGLADLVMPDREAFVARAAALATDREAVEALKRRLEQNRFTAPLFDAERFCRHLEIAFRTMADRARKGMPPQAFDVPALPPRTAPFHG